LATTFQRRAPDESRDRIMTLPLPISEKLDPRIDDRSTKSSTAPGSRPDQRIRCRRTALRTGALHLSHGYGPRTKRSANSFANCSPDLPQTIYESRGSTILLDRTTSVAPRNILNEAFLFDVTLGLVQTRCRLIPKPI